MTEQIVFFGKGGVGKSTLISNVSAALIEAGFRVLQIGCDSKADSCTTLNSGFPIPTVAEQLLRNGPISVDTVVHRGFKGVNCIELGNQLKNNTSVSKAIETIFQAIAKSTIFQDLSPDYVLYDVSGETSNPAFQDLFRQLNVKRVFVVTTADFMSLSAANSFIKILDGVREGEAVPFGGLIPNGISSSFEESFIADFAKHTGTNMLGRIPRSLIVRQCELYGKTVIEASPLSNQAYYYRRIANHIVDESRTLTVKKPPQPMSNEKLRTWAHDWADRLFALENGLVTDGAAI
jgi:nitrogenase iron protein NifH